MAGRCPLGPFATAIRSPRRRARAADRWSLVDAADGKSTQSLRQVAAEGVIGHLAARNSDDREGVRQKTPGGKIVKRRHEETMGEIPRSAENNQAAWAGRRSHICWDLVHYGSAASQCVDVLHALRQRHFEPAFAAILSAEHLAIARRDVDLFGVAVMHTDRHQRAMRRHPVEALPSLADVLAAVERAVFR